MSDNPLRDEAIRLADTPYSTMVALDETTDGEPIYVALNPELEGCVSQGDTVEEAVNNLGDARIDYIESLLEDGLSVPDPQLLGAYTIVEIKMVDDTYFLDEGGGT